MNTSDLLNPPCRMWLAQEPSTLIFTASTPPLCVCVGGRVGVCLEESQPFLFISLKKIFLREIGEKNKKERDLRQGRGQVGKGKVKEGVSERHKVGQSRAGGQVVRKEGAGLGILHSPPSALLDRLLTCSMGCYVDVFYGQFQGQYLGFAMVSANTLVA